MKRFSSHVSEAVNNTKKKQCTYLNNAIRKYGEENFSCELLQECERSELDKLEKEYITKYNSLFPNGYNLTEGGKGALYVSVIENNKLSKKTEEYKHSEETKAKIKERLSTIMSSDERKIKKSMEAKQQHLQNRLDKYKNILLKDDLTKYIRPVIKKGTETVYKYEVNINGIVTQFYDGKSSTNELYNNALDFLRKLKSQNNNV
jgi:group I intron endonuclease